MTTANERLLSGVINHQIGMVRVSNGVRRRMVDLLQQTERPMKDQITARTAPLTSTGGAGFTLDASTKRKLDRIDEQIRLTRAPGFKAVLDELTSDLQDIAINEPRFLRGMTLSASLPVEPTLNTPSTSELRKIVTSRPFQGRVIRDWAATLEASERRRIMNEIRIGLSQGQDVNTIVSRIVGTSRLSGRDGITARTRRDLQAVVRTAINHISSASAREFALANKHLFSKEIWVSILDGRTSDICLFLNGKLFNVGKGRYPPAHYNALAEGSLIETDDGPVSIERVRVGQRVLTHRGRMMPVTAVMSKPCDVSVINRLETASGNVILATDEHPVLTFGGGWKRADEINVGDKLFETPKQNHGSEGDSCVVGHANDYPSPFDEPLVPYQVLTDPGSVAASINLNGDAAQGTAFAPVLGLDKMGKGSRVDYWALSDVVSITRLPYHSQVYNLSVDQDETYVSDGIVTHNCRSRRAPLISNTHIVSQRLAPTQRRALLAEFAERDGLGRVRSVSALTPRQRRRFDAFSRQWLRDHVGGVPGVQTTEEFFKSQNASELADLLGVTKSRLVRRGNLTIGRLVDRHGRSLTLDELATKERSAFERAGIDIGSL